VKPGSRGDRRATGSGQRAPKNIRFADAVTAPCADNGCDRFACIDMPYGGDLGLELQPLFGIHFVVTRRRHTNHSGDDEDDGVNKTDWRLFFVCVVCVLVKYNTFNVACLDDRAVPLLNLRLLWSKCFLPAPIVGTNWCPLAGLVCLLVCIFMCVIVRA